MIRNIFALILKEALSRYGHTRLGYFWAIFEPLAHIITLSIIFSVISRTVPIGNEFPIFFMTGIIPFLTFSKITSQCMNAIDANRTVLAYPQIMPIDILLSRALLIFATMVIIFILLLSLARLLNIHFNIDRFLDLLAVSFVLLVLSIAVGFMNSTIQKNIPSYSNLYQSFLRPFYFISGIFFIADQLPPLAQDFLQFNILLHIVEWFRSAFYRGYESQFMDKEYVITVTFIALFLGLLMERVNYKKSRQI